MLSFSLVAEALTGLIYNRPSGENSSFVVTQDLNEDEEGGEKDSDADFEASRRSTWVQSKSRFALPYSWPNINWIVA